jgi:hypothetical protein
VHVVGAGIEIVVNVVAKEGADRADHVKNDLASE